MGRLAVEGIASTWLDASERSELRKEFEADLADLALSGPAVKSPCAPVG
jgi:hypothetical protein